MGFFKSNFTLIAENTAKYYLELNNRYLNRFSNDISLLAVAGILDAQNYIFASPPTIDVEEIFGLANDSATNASSSTSIKEQIIFEKRIQQFQSGKISAADFLSGDEQDTGIDIPESNEILVNFIFGLELLIFRADSPNISPLAIEDACREKFKTIEKAIVNTMNKYKVGKGLIAQATTNFMESPKMQPIRQQLRIV